MGDTAVVVCPRDGLSEAALVDVEVGGLGLLVRSLLTAQQAGFERLFVVASAAQQGVLRRQVAEEPRLAGRVRWAEAAADLVPPPAQSVAWVPAVVMPAGILRSWRRRASDAGGPATSAGIGAGPWAVPSAALPAFVDAAREGLAGLERFREQARIAGTLQDVPWDGAGPEIIGSPADVPAVERRMLRALRTPEDGPIVDRFVNRTISERISRLLVRWPVTPNQVTVASLLTGLVAAWLLSHDGAATSLPGLALFQLSVVLDHVDGEIARLRFQFSRLGKWLDNFSDHVVDLAVIACLAWRVASDGEAGRVAALGVAAAIGVTGSFLVVFWWSLAKPRDADGASARRGAAMLKSMANRDGFGLALWATVLVGRPAWFLWTLAVGSNVYWIVWLALCGVPATRRSRGARTDRPQARPGEVSHRERGGDGRPRHPGSDE